MLSEQRRGVSAPLQRGATVDVFLCERHALRRRNGILIGWLGFWGSLAGFVLLIDVSTVVLLLLVPMLAAPIAGLVMALVVAPTRMDDQYVWLRVGRAFLESFEPGVPVQAELPRG